MAALDCSSSLFESPFGGRAMKPLSHMLQFLFVAFLSILLAIPQYAMAQNHVVSSSDIQKDVAAASTSREKEVAQLESFFSSPQAEKAMKSVHATYQQVDTAIQQLSSDDLARLSARSEVAQKDFAAGRLGDRDLIIIALAILALILIIVAVR
jgi:hypothetical protein